VILKSKRTTTKAQLEDVVLYQVPHLLGSLFLEEGTAGAVARALNDCMRSYWPNLNDKKLKVMLSDAATAMIKACKDLQIFLEVLPLSHCRC